MVSHISARKTAPNRVDNPPVPKTGITVISHNLGGYNDLKYQLCIDLCPPSRIPILCL